MEDKKIMGTLFGVINYSKVEDLEKFVDNMTPQQALYCVVQKSSFEIKKDTIEEIEKFVLEKAIEILTTPVKEKEILPPPQPEIKKFE
jgi:hypothetical protein